MSEAGAGHALAQAAFVQEIAFQAPELAVEEVGGYFDQAHDHIGANRGIGVLDAFFEGLVIRARRAVELAKAQCVRVVGCPFLDVAVAHEVTVVFEQLLLAGLGDTSELDFRFLGSAAGFAAFEDVLFAGTGGLHHLVVGAGSPVDKAVAEVYRGVKDDEGLVVGEQLLVAAMRRDEALRNRKLLLGRT